MFSFLFCSFYGYSQPAVVVSQYFSPPTANTTTRSDEWTELLVVNDDVDMRNWSFGDNNAAQTSWMTPVKFNNIALWNHMRAGTVIVIWHRSLGSSGTPHASDISAMDGYLELSANDPLYFNGGNFATTLDIYPLGDLIRLQDASNTDVHALGHITSPPAGGSFSALTCPAINHAAIFTNNATWLYVTPGNSALTWGNPKYSGTAYSVASTVGTNATFGLPNTNATNLNLTFWRSKREPTWVAPAGTAISQAVNTQIKLDWSPSSTDPFPGDNTQGYIILRNTINSFIVDPLDGHTYLPGDVLGTATVVDNVTSSQTLTYTDNQTLACGGSIYYRIYAFRYSVDEKNGNDYNLARGRAYNEVNFCPIQLTAPIAPVAQTVTPASGSASYCAGTSGVSINLISSETGVNYYLYCSCPVPNTPVDTISGTGGPISFGNQTIPSTGPCVFSVVGSFAAYPACSLNMVNTVSVTILPTPSFTVSSNGPSTCLGTNGYIILSGLTPDSSYTVNYTTGATPNSTIILCDPTGKVTISNLSAGTYSNISVTTLAGCPSAVYAGPITLSDPPTPAAPTITASANPICNGQSTTLSSPDCSGTLTWTPAVPGPPYTVSPNINTTYTATCTSANNCTSASSFPLNLTVNIAPTIASVDSIDPAVCGGQGSIVLHGLQPNTSYEINFIRNGTPFGPYTFASDGLGVLTITNADVLAGTYTGITATPPTGCPSLPVTATLNDPGAPLEPITTFSSDTICEGQSVDLYATGCNGFLTWAGLTLTNDTITVYPTTTTTYTATCTESGCTSGSSIPITIVVKSLPAAPSINASVNPVCVGAATTLTAQVFSGNLLWSTGETNSSISVSPASTTTYTVTDSVDGCRSLAGSITINTNPSPTYDSIHPITTSACQASDGAFSIYGLAASTPYTVDFDSLGIPVTRNLSSNPSGILLISGLKAGSYSNIVVTMASGCSSNPPGTVTIGDPGAPPPPSLSTPNPSICPGGIATLNASGCSGGIITWSDLQTGTSIQVSPGSAASYTASCSLAGCISGSSLPLNIAIYTPPTILTMDTTGAINGQANGILNATASASTPSWEFSVDGGTSWWPTGNFNTLTPGPHTLMVRDGNGCITSGSFSINNIVTAAVFLTADTSSACPGDVAVIAITCQGFMNAKGVNLCISYDETLASFVSITYQAPQFQNPNINTSTLGKIWFYDNITPTITIPDGDTLLKIEFRGLRTGTGLVEWNDFKPGICGITDQSGNNLQVVLAQGLLDFYQQPVATINNSENACEGSPLTLTANDNTLAHEWTLPDGSQINGQTYNIPSLVLTDAGEYILRSTNTFLCSDRDTLQLVVHPIPQPKLADANIVCVESVTTLAPTGSYSSYVWQDNSTNSSMPNTGEGTYWVRVTDIYGCEGTDSLDLVVCPSALFVPSAFSPNGDGKNEVFRARYSDIDGLKNFKLLIYNRWGQLLFEGNDINAAWDGRYRGEYCPAGVYTYVIKFDNPVGKSFSQANPFRGLVTLVK